MGAATRRDTVAGRILANVGRVGESKCLPGISGRKESASFLKKRSKKLLPLVPGKGDASCAARLGPLQKFFGSFFQERTLS
jgi:hypothetical protein